MHFVQVPETKLFFLMIFFFSPEPFTAERAWGLLNCEYLRLTPSNVAALEEICSKAGYDVSIHPHKTKEDLEQEMKNMFKVTEELNSFCEIVVI